MAEDRYSISLGLDTSKARAELTSFEKEYVSRVKSMGERLATTRPTIFADEAKGADKLVKQILNVRKSMAQLKEEKRQLGKIMSSEWESMTPDTKKSRGGEMKILKENIAKTDKSAKQLAAKLKGIQDEPVKLLKGLGEQLAMIRSKLSSTTPSLDQTTILNEAKKLTETINGKFKDLASVRSAIEKIKVESRQAWMADKGPKNAETRKQQVVSMRTKQQPFVTQENELQAQISAMTNQKNDLQRSFGKASSEQYKKLVEVGKGIVAQISDVKKLQDYLDALLESADLPVNSPKNRYKPQTRGVKLSEQMPQFDPYEMLGGRRKRRGLAQELAGETPASGRTNKNVTGGRAPNMILAALVKTGAITVEQAAKTAKGLGGVGVQLVVTSDALEEFEASLRKANEATEVEAALSEDELRVKGRNAKTLQQKTAEREILGPRLGEVTTETTDFKRKIAEYNSYISSMLTAFSFGDESRAGGVNNKNSGLYAMSPSDNPDNLEDDAESKNAIITAKQFEEAAMLAFEAGTLQNEAATKLGQGIIPVLINRTKKNQFMSPFSDNSEDEDGNQIKTTPAWQKVDFSNRDAIQKAYQQYLDQAKAKDVSPVEPYRGQENSVSGLMGAGNTSSAIELMIAAITQGARQTEFATNAGEPNVGEVINPGSLIAMEVFDQLPKLGKDFVELAHEIALTMGIIKPISENPYAEGVTQGLGDYSTPAMTTFEKMFDANNYNPRKKLSVNGEDFELGHGPGKLPPVEQIGVKSAPITKIVQDLATEFKKIYGGTIAQLGNKTGQFDSRTFKPANKDTVNPVEMKTIEAFIENRKAFIDFVKTSRLTVSDITMALPAVDNAFEKLAMAIDQGVAGSKLSRGDIRDQAFSYRQGQQLGMVGRAEKRFGAGSSTTPIFSDLIDASGSVDDAVTGLANGVSAREKDIADIGQGMGKEFGGGFDEGIGRNSPAKYFIDAAGDAVEGVIVGSQMRLKDLNEAGRAMAESFNSGYSDQAKVEAIAKIENYLAKGNKEGAKSIHQGMLQAPVADQANQEVTGYKLSTPAEIAARNKPALESIDALKKANADLVVALDIESTGGYSPKDGKPGMRNRVFAYGATAGFGEASRQPSAGRNGVDIVRPTTVGVGHGMLVPPVDPMSPYTQFNKKASSAIGLGDESSTQKQIIALLGKRIDSLGYPEQNKEGSEQAYVNQLEDIAALLTKLYESGTPLAIHSKTLSDITTLGKEFAHYGIEAPTGGQMRDSGQLIDTQNMSSMLTGIFKEFGDSFSQKLGNIYKFFSGTEMGAELTPKTGATPSYKQGAEVAHDPQTDANATLVVFKSMMEAAKQYSVKQKGWFKELVDFATATVQDASSAIWGSQRERGGKSLQGMQRQAATHGGQLQPAVPSRRALVTPASTQATLFDDTEIQNMQDSAERRRAYEEELARLLEEREKEKARLEQERLKAERQYKIDMVEQLMSENKAIGFDNINDSAIRGQVITDAEKPKLAKNNAAIAKAMEDKDIAQGVATQINMNGKVRSYFEARLEKPSRELADEIQKAIDKAKRAINKMDVEAGTRTPADRAGRGSGGGKPPVKTGTPGGGYSDEPTPEYKALVQDSTNPSNQHASWFDQNIEQRELAAKRNANDLKGMSREVKAHEKVVADANRKMVDSWISTRYSLYDVASTYEEMGQKLRVLTSYIREAVMVNSAYETSFTSVERVMQPLPDELDGMRQRLVLMTQELPVAFDQLAKIATLGGQMGINADGINNFTEQVVKYSSITGMSAETVAEKFGRISQLADIPSDDFEKLASAVAFAGINAVATDQEIITLTESISAAANIAGFGADETIGLATAISSLGIAPEQARGVIVRLFGDIERSMQKGGKELDAYSKHLGLSAKETKNLWQTDPQGFFKRMLTNLSTSKSMTTALDGLNIKETREVNTLQRLAKNMDVYNQSMGDAKESYKNGTFLSEAYAKTQDNVAAKMEILNNQMKILQDNVGNAFAEGPLGLKGILDGLSAFMDFVNKLVASPIGKVVTTIVAGVTAMVAIFIAYQVASYKATAATLAMKTAMVQLGKMGGENSGIKGLLDVLTGQERMIIDSNGRLRSITKDRLDEMEKMGKIVPEGSPVDRALKAGVDVRKAALPESMDAEIASRSGMTLGPMSENAGQLLPNLETQGPSIAQLKEQIDVNRQLIEIRMQIAQQSLEASSSLRIYAMAQGDAAMAEKAAADMAASTREINRLGNMDEGLQKNLDTLNAPTIDPEAIVPKEVQTNVEQSTTSLNDMGAGLDSVATKADKGGVATTRFAKAVGVLSKAAGWIGLILGLVATATEIYKSFQIDLMEAGGGLDSFREAIYKDTAAWKENGEAIGTVQSKVTESKIGLTTWAQSMESTTGSSAKMTTAITETTDSITKQTLALGANAMEWLAQAAMNDDVIQNMFKTYFNAGKDLSEISKQANISLQDMVGMALSDPGKGAGNYLRKWFDASKEVMNTSPQLYTDLLAIANQLDGTTKTGVENSKMMKALGGAFGEAGDGAGDLNNQLDNTIARVYTLTDYVGDLSSILSSAFTIRYGKEEATDQLAASWENVKNRIDDAREAIEKIKDEIKSMTADRNILEYQLNIALKYGDTMRADKLRAELDAKNKELSDKNKELGKSQDAASTSLVGNTSAAADNRTVMRGLVSDYNKYLEALANTSTYEGLSDKQVAKKKAWLKKQADQAKADMLTQGANLGFSENEMAPYIKSFKDFRTIVDKLPKELTLRVDADAGTRAFMEFWAKQKGSGTSKSASSAAGGGTKTSNGKPTKPLWTGPSTPKASGDKQPVRTQASLQSNMLGAMWDTAGVLGDTLGQIFIPIVNKLDEWVTTPFDMGAGAAKRGQERYDTASLWTETKKEYQDKSAFTGWDAKAEEAAYQEKLAAWESRNEAEQKASHDINRQIATSGATKGELEAMAAKHAQGNPGVWNPFSGVFNPGKIRTGPRSPIDPSTTARAIFGDFLNNKAGGQKKTAIDAIRADDKKSESIAYQAQTVGAITSQGLGKEYIKAAATQHAQRYPGEYNPFSRTQNPWPQAQKDLQAKGLVPLKTRAEMHAITNPGEWNPYSGVVNPMSLTDAQTKQAGAMSNKKTRKALGEAHALKYPGEYNPYTESINPMFEKDSKKGAKKIADSAVEGAQKKTALDALRADDKKSQAATITIGKKKADPIYAYITNIGDVKYGGGPIKGYASGGLIPGRSPQNPGVDNLLATGPGGLMSVRSGEFIQKQSAVQYYGLDFMNAINNMQIPRYASGGMIGTVSGGGSSVVELSPSAVMQIMAIANRPVNLYSDDRQIASSANRGNMLLAMRGSN